MSIDEMDPKDVSDIAESAEQFANSTEKGARAARMTSEQFSKLNTSVRELRSTFSGLNLADKLGSLNTKGMIKQMADLRKNYMQEVAEMGKQSETLGNAMGAGITMGLAKIRAAAMQRVGDITGLNEIQERLMAISKQAHQTSIAFGDTFADSSRDIGMHNRALAESISVARENQETILGVKKALGEAFGGRDAITNLSIFSDGVKGVGDQISLTNTALLVSKATGMGHSEVVNVMNEAHLKLGASVEESAMAFGHIRNAAVGSGLAFKTVSDTMMTSAKTLKFYGTTLEAVSPLFKSFNESLRGVGKEGLTPELLQDFTSGLSQMSMGTKALLSFQAPGMGQQGVLGGALEVEQALATGEGMEDVTSGLIETLKQFGGQKLITREEALENPAQQRNYIIQRQVLGQLTKIGDPGKQNEMLRILGDIDNNGMKAGSDGVKGLRDLLKDGKEVAEKTTKDVVKATLDLEKTLVAQGDRITTAIMNSFKGTIFQRIWEGFGDISDAISMSASTPTEVIQQSLEKTALEKQFRHKQLQELPGSASEVTVADAQHRYATASAKEQAGTALINFKDLLPALIEKRVKEGKLASGQAIGRDQKEALIRQYVHKGTLSGRGGGRAIMIEALDEAFSGMRELISTKKKDLEEAKESRNNAEGSRAKERASYAVQLLSREVKSLEDEMKMQRKAIMESKGDVASVNVHGLSDQEKNIAIGQTARAKTERDRARAEEMRQRTGAQIEISRRAKVAVDTKRPQIVSPERNIDLPSRSKSHLRKIEEDQQAGAARRIAVDLAPHLMENQARLQEEQARAVQSVGPNTTKSEVEVKVAVHVEGGENLATKVYVDEGDKKTADGVEITARKVSETEGRRSQAMPGG